MNALDPYLPLAAGMYFHQTGPSTWKPTDAGALANLLQGKNPPEFRTILAVQGAPDFERLTVDQVRALAYAGPFYADLDGEIGEVIPAFKALLGKLRALGLDLEAVRLFATGGRGFHLEMPAACFLPSGLPAGGIAGLPHIYREMAHQLYVELMDMRVYSSKKGRMWRCVNVKRGNGKYKVPITADEALSMTVESYAELCAAPRAFLGLAAPTFCAGLGQIFAKARDKVHAPKKRRKAPEKVKAALATRFKVRGLPLPPSLLNLATGKSPAREGAGWNQICIQLAIVAHTMDLSEDSLVRLCAGLLENHTGDGTRYGTKGQREQELRAMFCYTDANITYDFSVGALKSILPKGSPCNDLEGL